MSDPMDIFAYDEISRVLGVSVEQAVVRESELLEALDMVYRRIGEISSLAEELQDELGEDQFDLGQFAATGDDNEAPVGSCCNPSLRMRCVKGLRYSYRTG